VMLVPLVFSRCQSAHHRAMHSFPTRRSSDLTEVGAPWYTSGTHMWNGTAPSLNARPATTNTRPNTSTMEFKLGAVPFHMWVPDRSEEHTSELQSRENLVCRLLLEKKNS